MAANEIIDGARLDMRLKDTDSWTGPMRHCEYRLRPEAQEPLPCPFCGATFWTKDGIWHTDHRDECPSATVVLQAGQVAAWNRRAPAPAAPPAETPTAPDVCQCGHDQWAHRYGAKQCYVPGCDCTICRPAAAPADDPAMPVPGAPFDEPQPAAAPRCPTCGGVGEQTTEQHESNPHRWYCLGCLEWWDESRRKPCQECAKWKVSCQALRKARANAEKRADAADARAARADRVAADAGWRLTESEAAREELRKRVRELEGELTKKAVAERCCHAEIEREVAEVAARTAEAEQYHDERDFAERRVKELEAALAKALADGESKNAIRQTRDNYKARAKALQGENDALRGRIDRALASLLRGEFPQPDEAAMILRGEGEKA